MEKKRQLKSKATGSYKKRSSNLPQPDKVLSGLMVSRADAELLSPQSMDHSSFRAAEARASSAAEDPRDQGMGVPLLKEENIMRMDEKENSPNRVDLDLAIVECRQNAVVGVYLHPDFCIRRFQFDELSVELSSISPVVTAEENEYLVSPIRDEEIQWAVFSANKDSAAGPDGFNNQFYCSFWSIIEPDVSLAIKEFFRSSRIVKGINKTHIVLLPKEEGADTLDKFHPISLCNSILKFLTRIMVLRMRPILSRILDQNQIVGRIFSNGWTVATVLCHNTRFEMYCVLAVLCNLGGISFGKLEPLPVLHGQPTWQLKAASMLMREPKSGVSNLLPDVIYVITLKKILTMFSFNARWENGTVYNIHIAVHLNKDNRDVSALVREYSGRFIFGIACWSDESKATDEGSLLLHCLRAVQGIDRLDGTIKVICNNGRFIRRC
ncbi:Transposon TX1 uncharacterized protein [Nymphaea thermarum]|nr:Transposon TX1 uncharacterized protein [Nymphaea thermarum]